MTKALLLATFFVTSLTIGCQESTAPKSGYFGARSDRGMNIDSDSPSIPEKGGPGLGTGTGTEPQGGRGPMPASSRDRPIDPTNTSSPGTVPPTNNTTPAAEGSTGTGAGASSGGGGR